MPVDPHWAHVSILLNMNGSDGGTEFTDASSNAVTVTPKGHVHTDMGKKMFGSAAAYFDGAYGTSPSAGEHLELARTSLFDFGSGDWTIEAWVYMESYASAPYRILFSTGKISSPWYGIRCRVTDAGALELLWSPNGTSASTFSGANGKVTLHAWHHVAFVRHGNTLRLFVDGEDVGSTSLTGTIYYPATGPVTLGVGFDTVAEAANRKYWHGWVDDFRVTKGVARYTAAFTPPAYELGQTIPGADITGNATVASGGPVDYVAVFGWPDGDRVAVVQPGENGDWSASVPSGQYGITYLAAGCQPVTHGPYTVESD